MSSRTPASTGYLYFGLLVVFLWVPLPWGSVNTAWLYLLLVLVCLIASIWFIQLTLGKQVLSPVLKKSWLPLSALITVQILAVAQYLLGYTVSRHDTYINIQLGVCYTLIFLLTLQLIDTQEKLKLFAMAFILAGTFQAFYGSFMMLSGIEYGFFAEKHQFLGMATGTYWARNHFAGFLEMSLAVGIGLMLSQLRTDKSKGWKDRWQRLLETMLGPKFRLRLYLAIMVVGLVLSRSRMGNTAFFVAVTGCGILALYFQYRYHHQRVNRNIIIFFVSMAIIDVLIVSNWFGIDKLVERMQQTSAETELRDEAARDTINMWRDNPIIGTGAGSFHVAYPKYRGADVHDYQFTAHNDYLEIGSEYGLIGFFLLGFTVLYCLWQGIRAQIERSSRFLQGMGFASTMGIVAILIHSFTDFNLQIPANALSFMVILAFGCIARHLPRSRAGKA
jgi:O-antigen ligase